MIIRIIESEGVIGHTDWTLVNSFDWLALLVHIPGPTPITLW
jgi:hypothetical protein